MSNNSAGAEGEALSVSHSMAPSGEGLVEWLCGLLAKVSLVAMMVIIGAEVVLRNVVQYSWEGTDEVGSYLVVAATFLSLATCQAYGGYHELQMVKQRLPRRARAALNVALNAVCLIASLILLWQFSRLVMTSWNSGDASSTSLQIPMWLPRLTMPIGIAALCFALAKTMLADFRAMMMPGADHPA